MSADVPGILDKQIGNEQPELRVATFVYINESSLPFTCKCQKVVVEVLEVLKFKVVITFFDTLQVFGSFVEPKLISEGQLLGADLPWMVANRRPNTRPAEII